MGGYKRPDPIGQDCGRRAGRRSWEARTAFALVIGFAQQYEKMPGVGTIVALMLPHTLATSVAWVLLFLAWYVLGLPIGPR
jgi:p-aminobenzoyl-glutamate transporter AbgT